ncbi:enoyl-CoA hydratase/isomerase family protein [Alkalicoccus daliensis]|uniref:Enoyl-CoA hydratase/carnithine racemase n=1 Tax=Alkalicoccus daliensis TaxID=745820 RepID=A0A1H0F4M3_9BACI|nr:enoyl-CoA hydratase/isomerase family protein [Alkalicoccus daliensis]SDN89610.1 Enoyl-CoA hydratase/carnithine racemase [Alkalicoccus daliensis]
MRVMIKRAPDGKITLQEGAKIAVVTISRPAARNALTSNMWRELKAIGEELQRNKKTRAVVVRGVPGSFTAGFDIKEFCGMSVSEANQSFQLMEETIRTFENIPVPVIGAVDGPAYGAGLIFSLAFDLRVGTENAKMGIPVAGLGINLGPEFIHRLKRIIGPARVSELVMLGEIYDAEKSLQTGLLNKVMEREAFDSRVLAIAEKITRLAPSSLASAKKAIQTPLEEEVPEMKYADETYFLEGCLSFVEKRAPRFL